MKIGIAGTGRMGAAIALRLKETGHDVTVWNRTPDKLAPLIKEGLRPAVSPTALAESCETIITILTNGPAQEAVYSGPQGLLSANVKGKLIVDMSTVQPHEIKALGDKVRATDATFVECPVGGTTGPARQGKLLGMAGGEAADIARAKPLLDQMCRRVEHVGPIGAGASMKLAINLPLLVAYQALGEAYVLCRHLGHDPKWLMEFFADTSGGPNILKVRGPAIAEALGGKLDGPAAFAVSGIRKDLRTMISEAKAHGTKLPLVEQTLAIFDDAAKDGWDNRDGSALPAYWPKRSA